MQVSNFFDHVLNIKHLTIIRRLLVFFVESLFFLIMNLKQFSYYIHELKLFKKLLIFIHCIFLDT